LAHQALTCRFAASSGACQVRYLFVALPVAGYPMALGGGLDLAGGTAAGTEPDDLRRWRAAHRPGMCYYRLARGFITVNDVWEAATAARFVLDTPPLVRLSGSGKGTVMVRNRQ
jgi:hypothetical protein